MESKSFYCESDDYVAGELPDNIWSPSSPSNNFNGRAISEGEAYATVATSSPKRRAGRRKFRETRHPVYKGVRRRNGEKWVCEVREPNKKSRIWLGTFPTPEMAARAHDVAAMALRGRSACLNFADSASLLAVPSSTDAKEIQRAAAEAAEAFRPTPTSEMKCSDELPFYMDEEAELGMPALLANMAEGMLLSPPHMSGSSWDEMESDADVSLWSYSI
uniref:CBF-like transcription factor c n=1 Tax=Cinnamomum camphora TaxID=13429 RepID=A0A0U2PUE7_CINCA|nr:CBF-like transcription factor c [Cinnamomum camphora]